MKAAVSVFVVFLVVALFLVLRKPSGDVQAATIPVLPAKENITATEGTKALTTIQWLDSIKHMGSVKSGEKVQIAYRFKNTGDKQLVVSNVVVSCGCTVAEKPERPIAPGEEGVIKAEFNSTGRIGSNHKTITVHTNTPGEVTSLLFDVDVIQ
ncbi:DUF1573 domain-containing protein [Pollutibacter soli]|uniref:DUF1573 domain-containing protein n=1 Tax=Pollutibacter soli TaxID=3034157 RepID=UPI00301371F8